MHGVKKLNVYSQFWMILIRQETFGILLTFCLEVMIHFLLRAISFKMLVTFTYIVLFRAFLVWNGSINSTKYLFVIGKYCNLPSMKIHILLEFHNGKYLHIFSVNLMSMKWISTYQLMGIKFLMQTARNFHCSCYVVTLFTLKKVFETFSDFYWIYGHWCAPMHAYTRK